MDSSTRVAVAPPLPERSPLRRLRNFRRRSWGEQCLFFVSLPLVAAMRVGLTFVGYRRLERLLARFPRRVTRDRRPRRGLAAAYSAQVGWAVTAAARFVPCATCLTQAVAARWLLARMGRPAQLSIGVAPRPEGGIEAHAWLISEDRIVTGGPPAAIARYTVITRFDA